MIHEKQIHGGEAPCGIGRGSGCGCTIKQLKAEMDAAMDSMKIPHTHGMGTAWGRGKGRRQKMLHQDTGFYFHDNEVEA